MKSFLVKFHHKAALTMTYLKILRSLLNCTICKKLVFFFRLREMDMMGTPRSFQISVLSNGKLNTESINAIYANRKNELI